MTNYQLKGYIKSAIICFIIWVIFTFSEIYLINLIMNDIIKGLPMTLLSICFGVICVIFYASVLCEYYKCNEEAPDTISVNADTISVNADTYNKLDDFYNKWNKKIKDWELKE